MIPKIDLEGGMSTPDYMIEKESYDLKTIRPDSHEKQQYIMI